MAKDNSRDAAKALETITRKYPVQHLEYLGVLNDQLMKFPYLLELYMKDQKRVPFAINYGRGFFRIWVLLTVVWVVGVAYVSGPDQFKLIENPFSCTGRSKMVPAAVQTNTDAVARVCQPVLSEASPSRAET
jgi:hypothetical protein